MATESDAAKFVPENNIITSSVESLVLNEIKDEVNDNDVALVNNDEFRKFTEREQYAIDKFEYPRNGNDPGLVLIFNQENFSQFKPRRGSRRDVNEIVLSLQRQGFNIDEDNILHDMKRDEILKKLKEVSEMDLSQKNCLIIFVLTHGEDFDRLHTSDSSISTNEIWETFKNCETLKNKPKMFIFQACKGDNFSTTMNDDSIDTTSKIVPHYIFSPSSVGPDMLVVYSTIEGNVSFRNPLSGSWFIQELCKNFTAYGRRDDVVSLIIRTTKCVCNNYFYHDEGIDQKQMPMFVSTLTKKFFLNRNKDRALLLKIVDENEAILSMLKIINGKLDRLFKKGKK